MNRARHNKGHKTIQTATNLTQNRYLQAEIKASRTNSTFGFCQRTSQNLKNQKSYF